MKIKVNEGWNPGIVVDDKLYEPGKELELPEEQARQFLNNGSAVEVKAKSSAKTTKSSGRKTR